MNSTVYREGCGTFIALRLHQANDEPPCSACLESETHRVIVAKLAAETIPLRPTPLPLPITPEQAAANRHALALAIGEIDRDNGAGYQPRQDAA